MSTFSKVIAVASLAVAAYGAKPTADDLHASGYSYTFKSYAEDFNKAYSGDELSRRELIYNDHLKKIQAHNSDSTQTWKMGINEYADMETQEFKDIMMGKKPGQDDGELPWAECPSAKNFTKVANLPKSLDWRTQGAVTPVKNQGGCGSCWAFSTAETLESHVFLKTGKLLTLSPQEFVDCVLNPNDCGGTGGCSGATQWLGFEYAIKNGVTTELDYPYKASTDACDKTKLMPVANITGYCRLPHVSSTYTAAQQYGDLMNAVNVIGPTAISVAAEPWQLYESGVYSGDCGADIDHAVQLVGYGTDKGILKTKDYWLVRNSWGEGWGEKGYIRVQRFGTTAEEKCLTDTTPGDGTACKGDPSTQEVCGLCGIMSDSSYPVGGQLMPPAEQTATF